MDDFTFDKEYSEKIKTRIAKTEQEVRRLLATQSSAMLEKERKFAALVNKGQQSFDNKEWNTAIGYWNEALQIKPDHKELEKQISAARQEIEQEASRKATELQNERAYKLLLASADSMFHAKQYKEAKDKYTTATRLNDKDVYPANKIQEINSILTALAKQETAKLKQEEEKI